MASTFTPTQNRGAALAREILDIIEVEVEEAAKARGRKTNTWDQGSWRKVQYEALPPGTEVEIVSTALLAKASEWPSPDVTGLAFSNGLSCGTSMCFAGHATHLVGDRMVVPASWRWQQLFTDGKVKGNFRRLVNRAKDKFHGSRLLFDSRTNADFVLTNTDKPQVIHVQKRAQKLLGLDDVEANHLFGAGNNLDQLRGYVQTIEEGRNIVTGRKKRRR